MARYARSTIDVPEWIPVSTERPCLVCGASSECTVMANGSFACCINVMCERPVVNGGWLHQLSELDDHPLSRAGSGPMPVRRSQHADPAHASIEGRADR